MRIRLAAAVLAATAVAATATPRPPAARFLQWTLGGKLTPNPKQFSPEAEPGSFQLVKPVSFRGRKLTAHLRVGEGKLSAIRLTASIDGQPDFDQMARWVNALCKSLGQTTHRVTPSPLGTPEGGLDWDPVILTHGRCKGVTKGVLITVSEEQTHASDLQRNEVEITAELAAP